MLRARIARWYRFHPVGFEGSQSMRKTQREYGTEIGRAVANFKGPMVFCVVSRSRRSLRGLSRALKRATRSWSCAVRGGRSARSFVPLGSHVPDCLRDKRTEMIAPILDPSDRRGSGKP